MEVLVTSAQMRECDNLAIRVLGIPGLVLMELAGRGTFEALERASGPVADRRILVVCGKGNNGGDGFVVARHALNAGAKVIVLMISTPSRNAPDANLNFRLIDKLSRRLRGQNRLTLVRYKNAGVLKRIPACDIVIDALFGTGFKGDFGKPYDALLNWMNGLPGFKVAIDIPSGLDADSGMIRQLAFRAHLTVTMGFRKTGLLMNGGLTHAGTVRVTDISLPRDAATTVGARAFVPGVESIRLAMPDRPPDAHKHSVGKVLVLAGSTGMTGAAALTAIACMKSGAGAVILGVPQSVYPILARKLTEVMVQPLSEVPGGSLGAGSLARIEELVGWADLVIVGPGLSGNPDTAELVRTLIRSVTVPVLLDADGINAFKGKPELLGKHRTDHLIITPHSGELARLSGLTAHDITNDRLAIGSRIAADLRLTLVMKGAPSLTCCQSGEVYFNPTGNPGMATAGAGDVLAGLLGGLWAQGLTDKDAAVAAVYLHGRAGDIARNVLGQRSMMALDILDHLPEAMREVERTTNRIV